MKIIFYRITIIKRRRPVMDDAALKHILFYSKFEFSARLIITKFNDVTASGKCFTLSERILDSVPILPCVKSLYVILLLLDILQSPPPCLSSIIGHLDRPIHILYNYSRFICEWRALTMSDKIEFWDIYDSDKKPTGRTMKRNDWHLKDGEYHLTVLGVMQRTDGRFLITKRVMTKAWAPGHWEVSGGAAMAGESSAEAVRREVLEETGLDVNNFGGGYLFTYRRDNPGEGDNYFVDVYRFTGDFDEEDVHLQTEETAGFCFATPDEIKELGSQGIFLHYDSIKKAFEV